MADRRDEGKSVKIIFIAFFRQEFLSGLKNERDEEIKKMKIMCGPLRIDLGESHTNSSSLYFLVYGASLVFS